MDLATAQQQLTDATSRYRAAVEAGDAKAALRAREAMTSAEVAIDIARADRRNTAAREREAAEAQRLRDLEVADRDLAAESAKLTEAEQAIAEAALALWRACHALPATFHAFDRAARNRARLAGLDADGASYFDSCNRAESAFLDLLGREAGNQSAMHGTRAPLSRWFL